MDAAPLPLTRDLVLIGGGHTHALVLRMWGMKPLAGARLTLVNPGPSAPYSGMLPGYVAGHYEREDLDIDLVRLARFAGARIVLAPAEGIDRTRREVLVPGRPPVAYDVCSIDIGITSDMPDLPGFAEHAVPAKPLGGFAQAWSAYRDGTGTAEVTVIGGGVAGAELAMAMAHSLRSRGRDARLHLVDSATALSGLGPAARRRVLAALAALGVAVIEGAEITEIAGDHIALSDGRRIASRFTVGAAGARPYRWLGDTGLELENGYIAVDQCLRSSDSSIFAAGDCAQMVATPRPKAGVYAVRQAPVIFHNLCAALGAGRMRKYRPQKDYLKLVSLGARSALAERFGVPVSGPLMWRWKDHIDRRFMARFAHLPEMPAPALPRAHAEGLREAVGDKPLCGGCGAKVGRGALRDVLASLPQGHREDVERLPGDDAALLRIGGARQVVSVDHLRALSADPVVMARLAAVHALGDIWAMGAAPQAALATIILPRLSPELQSRTLSEIMQAASAVMREAGAEIVGGHTSLGDELTIGFTVTGLVEDKAITLAGARPGDAILLTKPLGSGVIMAAEMRGLARGAWVAAALDTMMQGQGAASHLLGRARAMTDVTGFGLGGHLLGICEASGTGAEIDLDALPVMEGAEELQRMGVNSTLFPQNAALLPKIVPVGRAALLFDPQTAGGLLAAVPDEASDKILTALIGAGCPARIIGRMTDRAGQIAMRGG